MYISKTFIFLKGQYERYTENTQYTHKIYTLFTLYVVNLLEMKMNLTVPSLYFSSFFPVTFPNLHFFIL